MRECWVNVYVSKSGPHAMGPPQVSLSSALAAAGRVRAAGVAGPAYRLHVRLKPEPETRVDERGRVWFAGPTSSFRTVR